MRTLLSPLVGVLALALFAGCGFHLRSWELDSAVSSAYVKAGRNHFAAEPLRRGLQQAGVTLVPLAEDAEIVVELVDQRRTRRSVAVTNQARVAEYETNIAVRYKISNATGKPVLTARWVQATRIFRVDAQNIVGSSEEQALLEREMINDLVQQIIRSLDAATREATVAG